MAAPCTFSRWKRLMKAKTEVVIVSTDIDAPKATPFADGSGAYAGRQWRRRPMTASLTPCLDLSRVGFDNVKKMQLSWQHDGG